jgi:hypothetical protein
MSIKGGFDFIRLRMSEYWRGSQRAADNLGRSGDPGSQFRGDPMTTIDDAYTLAIAKKLAQDLAVDLGDERSIIARLPPLLAFVGTREFENLVEQARRIRAAS